MAFGATVAVWHLGAQAALPVPDAQPALHPPWSVLLSELVLGRQTVTADQWFNTFIGLTWLFWLFLILREENRDR